MYVWSVCQAKLHFYNFQHQNIIKKMHEWGFRSPLCTCRLNYPRVTFWGWWDEYDDTALMTHNSKFGHLRSEVEHATSRSLRLSKQAALSTAPEPQPKEIYKLIDWSIIIYFCFIDPLIDIEIYWLTLSSLIYDCHLHPLQAANCCRNSGLVVDENDMKWVGSEKKKSVIITTVQWICRSKTHKSIF